ncbi:MAG TPA: tetratricopeptide repeat protein [Xanthobacteraceae bacterium]|nr:tetratricopeptide repeat protein [Xanthobacteraceae bacterium]
MTASTDALFREAVDAHRRGDHPRAARLYRQVLSLDPRDEAACANLAIIAAQQGDLAGAERLFRRALDLRPNPEGLNNLGTLLLQQGRAADAIAAHRRAIALRPDHAAGHLALGNALKQGGELDAALAAYHEAVRLNPAAADAHNNIGVVLQRQGKLDEALAAYRAATALQPGYAQAHFNIGVVLHEQRDLAAAEAAYRRVIALRPDIADAYNNLGTVLQDQGRLDEALAAFAAAIERRDDYAEAHFNRGVVLRAQGRLELALAAWRDAMARRADYVEAINNAGIALQELGRLDEAQATFEGIFRLRPAHAEAYNNFGAVLLGQGRADAALGAFQQALTLRPDYPEAFYNLGNAWRELGKLEGAIAAYQSALRLRPDDADAFSQLVYHRWRACDWTDYASDQAKLIDLTRGGAARVPPFYLLATPATPADQLACARRWIAPIAPPPESVFRHVARRAHERIRLGYLSADFHEHATAALAAELFEQHDRARFEVVAYSYGPDDASPMRARLMRAFDRFVDIRALPHRAAAERIRDGEVDILIDLKGYTQHARPQIAAFRPAPVQVSYLGFPGTMGAAFIDYIMVDDIVAPPAAQPFFAEKLVHLPGSYQVNDRQRAIAASAPSRADCGLPGAGFVFCSFNNSYKITPDFFAVWMRLLAAVPGSVLWLLEANDLVARNLRRAAEARGIDPARLVFAPRLPSPEHLARHRNADLFLDTLPCNAHTTASDALWAGLPVLTCIGNTFAGRVAASLLSAIGMSELIAASPAEYERVALALARDRRKLADLRMRLLRAREASPLFELPRSARHLEAAYARMWQQWCAGEDPVAFSISCA